MKNLHSLLNRQLKKSFDSQNINSNNEFTKFIKMVDEAYCEFDKDHELLQRAIDISSEELLEVNSRNRAIIDATPDLFMIVDSNGNILDCKGDANQYLLISNEKLLGNNISVIPNGEISTKLSVVLESFNLDKETNRIDYSILIDDIEHYFEVKVRPLLKNKFLFIFSNVTHHVQIIEQLSIKNRYESILNKVTQVVNKANDLEEVIETSVDALANNFESHYIVSIFLVEEDQVVLKKHSGFPRWLLEKMERIPYAEGLVGKIIRQGTPSYCPDTK